MSDPVRVLIVDDDPADCDLVRDLLSDSEVEFAIVAVHTSGGALEALDQGEYDIVMVDYRLPKMNGLELMEKVREKLPTLPQILVTGYGQKNLQARALAAGAKGFLEKGLFTTEMLEARLLDALPKSVSVNSQYVDIMPQFIALTRDTIEAQGRTFGSIKGLRKEFEELRGDLVDLEGRLQGQLTFINTEVARINKNRYIEFGTWLLKHPKVAWSILAMLAILVGLLIFTSHTLNTDTIKDLQDNSSFLEVPAEEGTSLQPSEDITNL